MLTDEEMSFLKLLCTDMTYKEIAAVLKLNPRSSDCEKTFFL
jgi:DNA-binding CsgD family transcriptional regulator